MFVRKILIILSLFSMIISFQNCSDVDFSSAKDGVNGGLDGPGCQSVDECKREEERENLGILGGHFDLDTSSRVYELGHGETDKHVHEYDNEHDVTNIDYFNLEDGLKEIDDLINNTETRFILIVANAALSPGVNIEINGIVTSVVAYQAKVKEYLKGDHSALKKYTIGGDAIDLKSLRLLLSEDTILSGGLIPTQTGCVKKNNAGALGEYRNGALVIQAINVSSGNVGDISLALGVAASNEALLWESTVFWHKKGAGCY